MVEIANTGSNINTKGVDNLETVKEKEMNIYGLDKLDNQILDLISDNARMDYTEISKHVGITRVAVKNRIKAMEEKGVIKGYKTVIETGTVPGAYEFFIDIQMIPERLNEVVELLKESPMINRIHSTTGECRLHATGISSSPKEVGQLVRNIFNNVRGITRLEWEFLISDLMEKETDANGRKNESDGEGSI